MYSSFKSFLRLGLFCVYANRICGSGFYTCRLYKLMCIWERLRLCIFIYGVFVFRSDSRELLLLLFFGLLLFRGDVSIVSRAVLLRQRKLLKQVCVLTRTPSCLVVLNNLFVSDNWVKQFYWLTSSLSPKNIRSTHQRNRKYVQCFFFKYPLILPIFFLIIWKLPDLYTLFNCVQFKQDFKNSEKKECDIYN